MLEGTPDRLTLFVPHPESSLCTELAKGSAIVGLRTAEGTIQIYYEGNIIGAVNVVKFRDKATLAAQRMLHNFPAGYPTRARAEVDAREVVAVGTIDSRTGVLEITGNTHDLSWWIDPVDLADLGLSGAPS